MDEGIRLFKAIYDKLTKARAVIDEAQNKFSIARVVKVFEMIPKITTVIEDGYSFVYSDDYKQSSLELQIDLKRLLDRYYLRAINQAKCGIDQTEWVRKMNNIRNRVTSILVRGLNSVPAAMRG